MIAVLKESAKTKIVVNGGSIHDEIVCYLEHKLSKNKWKSKQVAKRCRNRQAKSSRTSHHHRKKRYYHHSNNAEKGIISSNGSKNLKSKRRLTTDAFINESMMKDIFDPNQCDLEDVLESHTYMHDDSVVVDASLMVLASPKRHRRRGKRRQSMSGLSSSMKSEIGVLSHSYTMKYDDYASTASLPPLFDDDYDSDDTIEPLPVPVKAEVSKEVANFSIEDELKSLGLVDAATNEEKKEDTSKLETAYKEEISNIEDLNEYAAMSGLAQRTSFKDYNKDDETTQMDPKKLKKVFKEIRVELPKNIVVQWNGSMFVRFDEDNPRFLQALLTGLDDTPYQNGLFLFDIYLHKDYPNSPLKIKHVTKGGNLVYGSHTPGGFSPNLHRDSGKVCLSLLGTWGTNQWDAKTSNIYQVLSSILFWIFGAKWAYYMEPSYGGWELTAPMSENDASKHKSEVITYNYEIIEKCMKYAILGTLRTPYVGFEEIIKIHFRIKKDEILKTILNKWIKDAPNAKKSTLIPLYLEIKQELQKL